MDPAQFVGQVAPAYIHELNGGGYIQGVPANRYFAAREGIPTAEYDQRRAAKLDPIQEYKMQLGDMVMQFQVDKARQMGKVLAPGFGEQMSTVPITELRDVYRQMQAMGYRRI